MTHAHFSTQNSLSNPTATREETVLGMARVDSFGARVGLLMTEHTHSLPHDLSERLRAARVRAVAARKRELTLSRAPAVVGNARGTLTLGGDEAPLGWLGRLGSVLPLVVLVVGLVAIEHFQSQDRANELASVDRALLIDDLPPSAYTDPGFAQFIKNTR